MPTSPDQQIKMIAKRLRNIRLQKTWTREMLSEKSGVNQHTLKRFERTGHISLERLCALCVALEVSKELEKLFRPTYRVDINHWEAKIVPLRKRGIKTY